MAPKKGARTKRSQRVDSPVRAAPKRTRKKARRTPPRIKGELPEPIATFVF
jgi:hypothetical protein